MVEDNRRLRTFIKGKWSDYILLVLIFLLVFAFSFRRAGSHDTGFHLKAGNYILDGNGFPEKDSFTYTLNDRDYTDTTWGYQVVLSLVNKIAGVNGMILFNVLLVMLTCFFLYRTAALRNPDIVTVAVFMIMAVIASEARFEVRPETASYFLLSLTMFVLHRYSADKNSVLWPLPIISLIWVNTHALFFTGWAAVFIFFCGLWLKERKPDAKLGVYGGLSFLAGFMNPYFVKGMLFPFILLTRFDKDNIFAQSIPEFISPFRPGFVVFSACILIVCSVFLIWPYFRKREYWNIFLLLAFAPLAVKMSRNIPLFVIVSIPLFIGSIPSEFLKPLNRFRKTTLTTACVVTALLICRVFTDAYYIADRRQERTGLGWNDLNLPVQAAEYIKGKDFKSPMINDLAFGGYLMWVLDKKVFIDGRLEVTGEKFFVYAEESMLDQNRLDVTARKYGADWIIFNYPLRMDLLKRMSADRRWKLAYFDHISALFVRNDMRMYRFTDGMPASLPEGIMDKSIPGDGIPSATKFERWVSGFYRKQIYPAESCFKGIFHYQTGNLNLSEYYFRLAIIESRGFYHEIYRNLAVVLFDLRRYDDAARFARIALQDDQDNEPLRRMYEKALLLKKN